MISNALSQLGSFLNERGVGAILNLLGEYYHERSSAFGDTMEYCHLIAEIGDRELNASISVKPSQIGLEVGNDVFEENLAQIVDHAVEYDVFV